MYQMTHRTNADTITPAQYQPRSASSLIGSSSLFRDGLYTRSLGVFAILRGHGSANRHPRCLQRSRHRNAATPQNMDWLREAVAEYLSGFSNETGSPPAARSGFLTQLCRGRRRIGIDDSAACGRTGRVMLGKF